MKKKPLTFLLRLFLVILLLAGLSAWWANHLVVQAAKDKTWSRLEDVTPMRTGLLLGTSKTATNGRDNLYFTNRIEAAAQLLKAGKIKYLVISGDNSSPGYNEPIDMRTALIAQGVDSTKIYLDYAGFRTFDSMVRVKKIFDQDTVLVISQKFHNERAIYIAQKLQICAYGYNAADLNKFMGFRTAFREKLARAKVVLDFLTGVKPRFLGPKVKIG